MSFHLLEVFLNNQQHKVEIDFIHLFPLSKFDRRYYLIYKWIIYITKMIDHKPKRYTKIETQKYQMYSFVNLVIILFWRSNIQL